jgi:hypothetical protein
MMCMIATLSLAQGVLRYSLLCKVIAFDIMTGYDTT